MTDALIRLLASDLRPVARHAVARRLTLGLLSGAAASAFILAFVLGVRPDLPRAASSGMFWLKFLYGGGLAAIGLGLGDRLARPEGAAGGRAALLVLPIAVIGLASIWQLCQAPPQERYQLVFGSSADLCPTRVILLSLAPLAGVAVAARGLAPTRLALAGAVLGMAAGGAGSAVYALQCSEPGAPFVGLWYSLGVAVMSLAGALMGPRALRW